MAHTPGPWSTEIDPIDGKDYATLIVHRNCGFDTWLARTEHNWNEAEYGERRISWAEAQANARLIAAAPELLAALQDMLGACLSADAQTLLANEWITAATVEKVRAAQAAIAKATGV